MTNLSITSVTYLGSDHPNGRPEVEISGEWLGSNRPPSVVKNIYKDEDDHLLQDIFRKTEESTHVPMAALYTLASINPQVHASNYGRWVVSYRFVDSLHVTPVEIVSDFVFGESKDEYTAWNLLSRQMR